MRSSNVNTLLFAITIFVFLYVSFSNVSSNRFTFRDSAVNRVWSNFTAWHDCIMQNITTYKDKPDELWSNLWKGVKLCEKIDEMKGLPIKDFQNSDETKRHILPKINFPSVVVTLGIGHDTAAEEKLIKNLPTGSEFFGADPMHEVNEALYTKLPGKYFPFAVGSDSGLAEASVLINTTYATKTVVNVDIIYFLKNIVKRTFIDDIWIDAEGAEYGIFSHFYRDGEFDRNGISFCQFNIEIHKPDSQQKKLIHDFIFQLLQDKRYAIYRPVQGYHMRLYMLNFDNEECVGKYLV